MDGSGREEVFTSRSDGRTRFPADNDPNVDTFANSRGGTRIFDDVVVALVVFPATGLATAATAAAAAAAATGGATGGVMVGVGVEVVEEEDGDGENSNTRQAAVRSDDETVVVVVVVGRRIRMASPGDTGRSMTPLKRPGPLLCAASS
jgi:hypothetical protein